MSNDLHSIIRQLAEGFAAGVLAVIRAAWLQEVDGDGAEPRASTRPPRKFDRTPSPPQRRKSGASNVATGADALLDMMVETSKRFPAGLRSEELRALLKVEKVPFRLVAAAAVDTGLLKRTGEKRATTYFPS